jgi:hypothetical protein
MQVSACAQGGKDAGRFHNMVLFRLPPNEYGLAGHSGSRLRLDGFSGIVLRPRPSPAPSRHSGARHRDYFGAIHGQLALSCSRPTRRRGNP